MTRPPHVAASSPTHRHHRKNVDWKRSKESHRLQRHALNAQDMPDHLQLAVHSTTNMAQRHKMRQRHIAKDLTQLIGDMKEYITQMTHAWKVETQRHKLEEGEIPEVAIRVNPELDLPLDMFQKFDRVLDTVKSEYECGDCQESLTKDTIALMASCGHGMCKACVLKWSDVTEKMQSEEERRKFHSDLCFKCAYH